MPDSRHSTGLLTVGHGALDRTARTTLLRDAGVDLIVDVRRFPLAPAGQEGREQVHRQRKHDGRLVAAELDQGLLVAQLHGAGLRLSTSEASYSFCDA